MSLFDSVQELLQYLRLLLKLTILFIYGFYCYLEIGYQFMFPAPPKSLKNEIILITGSGNGIGRQICLQLADSGAKLICWDCNTTENENTVRDLRQLGAKAFGYEVDVSQKSKVEEIATKIKNELGDVTIIINNAGIVSYQDFLSQGAESIEKTFDVNVLSYFWILQAFLPKMIEKNHGHIVSMSSMAGIFGTHNMTAYCGSKFAVNGILVALKEEMVNHPKKPDIKFTTVYPYWVKTNAIVDIHVNSTYKSTFPMLDPVDVARDVVDGMRRNYEHIYCPSKFSIFETFKAILPTKLARAVLIFSEISHESKGTIRESIVDSFNAN